MPGKRTILQARNSTPNGLVLIEGDEEILSKDDTVLADATAGPATLQLYSSKATTAGCRQTIIVVGGNSVTLLVKTGQTIDWQPSVTLTTLGATLVIHCDGRGRFFIVRQTASEQSSPFNVVANGTTTPRREPTREAHCRPRDV